MLFVAILHVIVTNDNMLRCFTECLIVEYRIAECSYAEYCYAECCVAFYNPDGKYSSHPVLGSYTTYARLAYLITVNG